MTYCIVEKDILPTIRDFAEFCDYIKENEPPVTKKGNLAPKNCYEINSLLTHPREEAKQTDHMPKYEAITLYYLIALSTDLIRFDIKNESKISLKLTERYDIFKHMNTFTQYMFIFISWMSGLDIQEAYEGDLYAQYFRGRDIDAVFSQFGKMTEPEWLSTNSGVFGDPVYVLHHSYRFVHHLADFGLVDYDLEGKREELAGLRRVARIRPTNAGLTLMRSCETRRFTWLNELENPMALSEEDQDIYQNDFVQASPSEEAFWKPFLDCFPRNVIDYHSISELLFIDEAEEAISKCVFQLKVELRQDCYRIIKCAWHHTFEDLHNIIQKAFSFDNEHLYVFFPDGSRRPNRGIYSPHCDERLTANAVNLCDVLQFPKQHITYLFDFGDNWEFVITVQDIDQQAPIPAQPEIIKSVGTAPSQYHH